MPATQAWAQHSRQIASFDPHCFRAGEAFPASSPITESLQTGGKAGLSHLESVNVWCLLGEATLYEPSTRHFADTELTSLYL